MKNHHVETDRTGLSNDSRNITAAWQKRADWLARWTLSRLANRTDLWGRYLPLDKRHPGQHGEAVISRIGPVPSKRGVISLSERLLIRHYRGEDQGHILGLQSASANHLSRWMAIDLDRHNKGITPLDNLRAATHWRDELLAMGFHPLLIDSDGAGGYGLLVLFREPLPTAKVFDFADKLVRDHSDVGLEQPPAILPNAPMADQNNWLRLPGRHPAADHWSRVWNGHQWLEGADAVEALLHAHGDSPTLIRKLIASTPGSGMYHVNAAKPPMPPADHARHHEPAPAAAVVHVDPQAESQVLAFLLAATRTGEERVAFGAVNAADLSAESFRLPTHRHIFTALEKLHAQGERITPTDIAEEIPAEHRPIALAAIDELILEKPVDAETFERRLATLAKNAGVARAANAPASAASVHDADLQSIISTWACLEPSVRRAISELVHAVGSTDVVTN